VKERLNKKERKKQRTEGSAVEVPTVDTAPRSRSGDESEDRGGAELTPGGWTVKEPKKKGPATDEPSRLDGFNAVFGAVLTRSERHFNPIGTLFNPILTLFKRYFYSMRTLDLRPASLMTSRATSSRSRRKTRRTPTRPRGIDNRTHNHRLNFRANNPLRFSL